MSPVLRSPRHPRQPGEHQSRSDGIGLDAKKKTIRASEQDEATRSAWREQAKQLSTQDLVIVDETGSLINIAPLYAYAPRGERTESLVPRNYGANLTLIASLEVAGMGEALLLDGSADATAFETYVEQILALSLRPGQIVLLDNRSLHLGPRVQQTIEACAAWARARARRWKSAIIQALPSITSQDALGWFLHCGYPAPETGKMAQHV